MRSHCFCAYFIFTFGRVHWTPLFSSTHFVSAMSSSIQVLIWSLRFFFCFLFWASCGDISQNNRNYQQNDCVNCRRLFHLFVVVVVVAILWRHSWVSNANSRYASHNSINKYWKLLFFHFSPKNFHTPKQSFVIFFEYKYKYSAELLTLSADAVAKIHLFSQQWMWNAKQFSNIN